ncbi:expressed unknown protein [Seminavis robusta]|uniref:Uncharacterized protein n=1 Tax=Seminavis robusta TaxID=568900 RepID=A0A9N8HUU1_9STRA|nr:expressed unknown protein [Seminavis robusta]|eukprot:Sro1698_g291980.1 n/a (335) ;mRNA; r:15547-16551
MALVLCDGIGKICTGCCDLVGQVCLLPCKVCDACCKGFGQCCSESCAFVTGCCSSRFCCHITVTIALNLPPILLGLMDLPNAVGGCPGSLWLLVFWLLSLVHIVAAFYMAYAVEKDESILPSRDGEHTASGGANRMWKLFCYDGWMAAYILVACGYFGWLLLGGFWYATGNVEDSGACDEGIGGTFGIAYGFGWAFLFLGGCGLGCSVCCGLVMDPPGRSEPPAPAMQQQPPQQYSPTATPAAASAKPTASTTVPTASATVPMDAAGIPDNDKTQAAPASSAGLGGLISSFVQSATKPASKPMMASSDPVEVEAVPAANPQYIKNAPMASAVPY